MRNLIRIVAKYPTYWDDVVVLPEGKTAEDIVGISDKWGAAVIHFSDGTELKANLSYIETDTKYSEEIHYEEYDE